MSLVVVGSIALDTIEAPTGRVANALGGSGTHFALAAALLTDVRLMGYIGRDFPREYVKLLADRGVNLVGLREKDGKTFRWSGRYAEDMNVRETIGVELNVFGQYEPLAPPEYADSEFVFLANGSPAHQLHTLDQLPAARFAVADTMDHWIESSRPELETLLGRVNAVVINDGEARLLTGKDNIAAAREILAMGPEYVVVKKGEHGAVLVGEKETFLVPAFPVADVRDPTGAGDTFAGGMMGHLARSGEATPAELRRAIAYGTILASFNVEDFGARRVASLSLEEVEARLAEFRRMLKF